MVIDFFVFICWDKRGRHLFNERFLNFMKQLSKFILRVWGFGETILHIFPFWDKMVHFFKAFLSRDDDDQRRVN